MSELCKRVRTVAVGAANFHESTLRAVGNNQRAVLEEGQM